MALAKEIQVLPRTGKEKHVILLAADSELALLSGKLFTIREFFNTSRCLYLLRLPDPGEHVWPTPSAGSKNIQERYTAINDRASAVECYVRLRGISDAQRRDVPMPGDDSLEWLKNFKNSLRETRAVFNSFKKDVTFHFMVMLAAITLDARQHYSFAKHYTLTLVEATAAMRAQLGVPAEVRCSFWDVLFETRLREYLTTPGIRRMIPNAAMMKERDLVVLVADHFRHHLEGWDATHGIEMPGVRRILEAFAFKMVPMFDEGRYRVDTVLQY